MVDINLKENQLIEINFVTINTGTCIHTELACNNSKMSTVRWSDKIRFPN